MAKRNQQFQTIRTEGAILPPDILRLVASLKVDGATPDAYHLPPGSKLNEAISQSWTSLLNHWQAFQEARDNLPESDETGTSVTNERWLLPLFNELDYGRLVTTRSPEIDERVYPIERFYNHTPIHLIGCKLPLDRRTRGARGAATASPHSMVQEFINRSEEHLWAFLSNGLQLRILRDNISLSRQAFVEFDLEAMMDGEVYSDFALLWLLCHQSRVESDKAADCWLEKWSQLAREQGTRVLNDLRVGVQKAIEALGRGFIGNPRNDQLREKLRTGTLSTNEYYRQLLRTVYRLLFLFVAEDRELLHPPLPEGEGKTEGQKARELYDTHYSTRRLRELAHKIRGSKHSDLWHSLSLVFDALGRNEGCPELGLCGLGSFLWRSSTTADIRGPQHEANGNGELDAEPALITNDDLLQAIRALAYVEQDRVLRIVDYRNLGSEELGSVYESLLELHPVMNAEAKAFDLSTAAGNERKTTGSYYTPDSLVQCLLDSALDPVVDDRLKGKRGEAAEQSILDLKVCDPACGSGHFLIAAAHRLARHLARVRTGETEPSPDDYQHALRDVIGRCVYGVDLNPMAVELCKVSLWMEAIEPGKPLSFLDHHIQCGNSLLGVTPALIAKGIPDDAFKPVEGDVKTRVSALRKDNKRERKDYESGQGYLFSPTLKLGNLPATVSEINSSSDDSLEDISAKQEIYEKLVKGADYLNARLLADTWCAAFVWKKDDSDLGRLCPTERAFRSIEDNPHSINVHVKAEVLRLRQQYRFFHWHLTFPDVFVLPEEPGQAENEQTGWSRGFDVVLGNPPWERVKLQEKEWFAERAPEVANAKPASRRKKMIAELADSDPDTFAAYSSDLRFADSTSFFLLTSGNYPLTGRGDINTYAVFSELNSQLVNGGGRVGCIVPSGLCTDDSNQYFFRELLDSSRLVSLLDFENRNGIFVGVHRSYKFALLTLSGGSLGSSHKADFCFFLLDPSEVADESRHLTIAAEDIRTLNPKTQTCPIFRQRTDYELAVGLATGNWLLDSEGLPSAIQIAVGLRVDNSKDSYLFVESQDVECQDEYLPFYEGKMVNSFDHRFASWCDTDFSGSCHSALGANRISAHYLVPIKEAEDKYELLRPYYIGLRRLARSTDERTIIASVLPSCCPAYSFNTFQCVNNPDNLFVLANANAYVLDYLARQKLGGANVTWSFLRQLHFYPPSNVERFGRLIRVVSLELTYTAWDLEAFALDCGYDGPPFRWDEERRFLLRCELDAAYFHLYLGAAEAWGAENAELREIFPTPRDAVAYIMETFPIMKRKDIARTADVNGENGYYITKDTILEMFDEMNEAVCSGNPYKSRVDPSPGPPSDAGGNFIPMAEWDSYNWPSHIHAPRKESKVAT